MATSAGTSAPPHPPPQSPFTTNGARDAPHSQSSPQSYSTFTVPTTAMTPDPTSETVIKKTDYSPTYSLFPSIIHTKTSSSIASSSSQSLQCTTLNISPTTTNISSIAMEVSLPSRQRAREIEIFGKRPFEFRFSRHRTSNGEKERKKMSRTVVSGTEPEKRSMTPTSPTNSVFLQRERDGEVEKFSFEFDNGEVDLTFPFSKSKPAFSASSIPSITPSPQRQSQKDEDLEFPFGRPLHRTSTRGRGLGSVDSEIPLSPLTTQQAQIHDPHPGTLVTFSSSTGPLFASSEKSNEWNSSTNYSSSGKVSPTRKNNSNARILTKEYHRTLRYLALGSHPSYTSSSSPPTFYSSSYSPQPSPTSSQPNMYWKPVSESAPVPVSGFNSTNSANSTTSTNSTNSITSTATIYATSSLPTKRRMENVDYQDRKLERRARSLQNRDTVLRYGSSFPSSNDTQSMCNIQHDETAQSAEPSPCHTSLVNSKHGPGSVRSTHSSSSASSTSISVFLSSVRASFEARQSRELCPSLCLEEAKGSTEGAGLDIVVASSHKKTSSYDIFMDEQQRGFLDDWLVI